MQFIKNAINFRKSKKIIERILLLILTVLFLLPAIVSCGDKSGNDGGNQNNTGANQNGKDTDGGGETASDSAPTEAYIYPQMDGGGADFTFLAPTTTWFYYTDIVKDEMSGEVLDDAIYTRNRFIESQFNINFKEVSLDIGQIIPQLKKVVLSGEDVYDASFCPVYCGGNIGSLITQNFFYNLNENPMLNLDEKWWNQTMRKEASIGKGDKLYYAGCDIDILTLQSVSCVYFNQDMMTNLGLELPYNAAREGKWTFDLFQQYMKSGASLNGADSFKWEVGGKALYGFTSYEDSVTSLLEGSGERFIITDSEGMPHPGINGERFINVLTKLQDMLQLQNGEFLYSNGDHATGNHYEPIFRDGRALLAIGELKATDVFREMDATFGIVPIPKYDENQQDYYSHLIFAASVLVIPVTNPRVDFTGAVLDAMAYVSNRDVTPVLFDVSVSQKRLRNEDSIEMLQIIKNSGSFDIGLAYGWTSGFYDAIRGSIGQGKKFDIASQIDKYLDKINANIDKTMELFE